MALDIQNILSSLHIIISSSHLPLSIVDDLANSRDLISNSWDIAEMANNKALIRLISQQYDEWEDLYKMAGSPVLPL